MAMMAMNLDRAAVDTARAIAKAGNFRLRMDGKAQDGSGRYRVLIDEGDFELLLHGLGALDPIPAATIEKWAEISAARAGE